MTELFRRHLDLAHLRGRQRGVTRCPFHKDRTPSLSVDLARGLFNCFGCGAQGGVRRFAKLVDERSAPARSDVLESPLQQARRRVAQQACREGERAADWAAWNLCADHIRRSLRVVDQVRAVATTLGPEHPRTWPALDLAARVEREALDVEAELDDILASGRVA